MKHWLRNTNIVFWGFVTGKWFQSCFFLILSLLFLKTHHLQNLVNFIQFIKIVRRNYFYNIIISFYLYKGKQSEVLLCVHLFTWYQILKLWYQILKYYHLNIVWKIRILKTTRLNASMFLSFLVAYCISKSSFKHYDSMNNFLKKTG